MDFKQIQELIKTVNKSNISELSIQDGEFQITIKQGAESLEGAAQMQQMGMHMMMPMQQMQMPQMGMSGQQGGAPLAIPAPPTPSSPADAGGTGVAGGNTIKSPMIGTFYRSSSPDKPAFVNVGDEVKKGQVLCIIEAMKLFNEIESEVSGRIIKVLADDASPVEYDQPLFLVEPI
jgi:acetyl-CoA carboxylase biotin carboxyl carrier protein